MKALVIDKSNLKNNIEIIKETAGVPIIGVLKADGYGLGLLKLAEVLQQNGINHFAVTEPTDALTLRNNGFTEQEILIMRSTSLEDEITTIIEACATATVGSYDAAVKLNGMAKKTGLVIDAHLKVDTGMGRYGFSPQQFDRILNAYTCFNHLNITGIYTHFHSAFSSEKATMEQLHKLNLVVAKLRDEKVNPGLVHAANSSALFKYGNDVCLDAVRIGSAFTGRIPTKSKTNLKKVCYLRSKVIETSWLPAKHPVGYGAGFITTKPTQVAVIPIGYADGFATKKMHDIFRFRDSLRYIWHNIKDFSKRKKLYVTINGKKVRILGHVGLCHVTIDITNTGIKIGDEAFFDISPLFVNPNIQKSYE